MSAVEYQNIGKSYGAVKVMEKVSFAIAEGRFVVLLGPSGCGKTTLLRMTAGLEKISTGDILFSGKRINNVHPRDRDIAMVFQSYALYPQMTVFDNIAFSLQIRKLPEDEIKKSVEQAADILGLTGYLDRYPKALSGGQRQRVAMGRALVRHPKVFLFDEPLSNLDAKLRAQMRYEIRRLHEKLNTTTIYVTHDQIEAMTMADDIVVMRNGSIEQMGSPDEIYGKPVNTFVADFIGSPSINFLHGKVVQNGADKTLQIADQVLPIPDDTEAIEGQAVTLGIRPLDLSIEATSAWQGELTFVENTGADKHLHIQFAGQLIRVVSTEPIDYKPGDAVGIRIDPDKMHLFDQETAQRINY